MRPILILLVSILAALNSSSQVTVAKELPPQNRVKDTTKVMPAKSYTAMVNDINEAFAALEQSIEVAYAKLKKELKDNIDKIHDKIKELDKQITELEKQAKKLEEMVQRQEHQRDSLAGRLTAVSWDVSISEKLLLPERIVNMNIQINQTEQNLEDINKQIDKIKSKKQQLKDEIKKLEAEIVQLEKNRVKTLQELEKEKQKALRETEKRSHEKNYNNVLVELLNGVSMIYQDSIRSADLRYRRIR